MEFDAAVIDLDGTLLDSSKSVSERSVNAIRRCHQAGMNIIIATARPPRAVKRFLPEELRGLCSFVYYNGALIGSKALSADIHEPIAPALTGQVLDHCIRLDPNARISVELLDEWYSDQAFDESVLGQVVGRPVVQSLEQLKTLSATKIIVSGISDAGPLQARFGRQLNIVLTDKGTLLQISARNATKEHAVAVLGQVLGIPLSRMIAFGDDTNDLGLFQACGYSVAMANAVEPLQRIADEMTKRNDDDGVAIVLERFA